VHELGANWIFGNEVGGLSVLSHQLGMYWGMLCLLRPSLEMTDLSSVEER
jgi:hypothetical protein